MADNVEANGVLVATRFIPRGAIDFASPIRIAHALLAFFSQQRLSSPDPTQKT